jgi:quercetin dioxygenase-like cupin family protein
MSVTQPARTRRWLVGPETGAEHFLIDRRDYPSGVRVGLHRHDGEEAHLVERGEVRFAVDGERRVFHSGEVAFAPIGSEHGFVTLTEATIVTIREQRLGSWAVVLEPDGSRREVEIFRNGPPWSKQPPEGEGPTPDTAVESYYRTTEHLL